MAEHSRNWQINSSESLPIMVLPGGTFVHLLPRVEPFPTIEKARSGADSDTVLKIMLTKSKPVRQADEVQYPSGQALMRHWNPGIGIEAPGIAGHVLHQLCFSRGASQGMLAAQLQTALPV